MNSRLVAAALLLAACGGSEPVSPPPPPVPPPPPPPAPASVVVTPDSVRFVSLGDSARLTATVRDGAGNPLPGAVVTWASSAPGLITVSATGTVVGFGNGSATVTATSGTVAGTARVVVDQEITHVAAFPAVAKFTALGDTTRISFRAADANDQVVPLPPVLTVDDPTVVSAGAGGLLTALANGTAVVTANWGQFSAEVAVTVEQLVASVVVTPAQKTLVFLGETVVLTATATDAQGHPVPYSTQWQTANPTIVTVDQNGLVTAVGNGQTTVHATVGPASFTNTATITVQQAPAAVTVTPGAKAFSAPGQTQQLSAAVQDGLGTPIPAAPVAWSSSNLGVATVSAAGLVTAQSPGAATVTASAGPASGTAAITVAQPSIELTPATMTFLSLVESKQFTATVRDGNGVPLPGAPVAWQSSNGAVVTVSATGLATSNADGVATVTATSGSLVATAAVTVHQTPASVSVAPTAATLVGIGATKQLAATVKDAAGTAVGGAPVTWSSADPAVATVSASGLVTAQALGTTNISAVASGPGGPLTMTAAITVEAKVSQMVITAQPQAGRSGASLPLVQAELRDAGGAVVATAGGPVTITLLQGTGAGTLNVTSATANQGFVAFVPTISEAGRDYRIRLDFQGISATSDFFDIAIQFTSIAAGYDHTCGVAVGNALYCWGRNDSGQLGLGDAVDRSRPTRVGTASWHSVGAGGDNTCARAQSRDLYCWGPAYGVNVPTLVAGSPRMVTVRTSTHGCGLAIGIGIACWGDNGSGQLGRGTTGGTGLMPAGVLGAASWTDAWVGDGYSCALDDQFVGESAGAHCWGGNDLGQLGTGDNSPSNSPVPVAGGLKFALLGLGNGSRTTCGIGSDTHLYCWGRGTEGQLGNGGTADLNVPTLASGGLAFDRFAVGYRHACGTVALTVYCWGANGAGEAGIAPSGNLLTPTLASGVAPQLFQITAGKSHTCGMTTGPTAAGTLFCWGSNAFGQLGTGTAGGPTAAPILIP
ncbi:MAG: Ig-like domain-containing protein [Gemmatimonadales bacterium]